MPTKTNFLSDVFQLGSRHNTTKLTNVICKLEEEIINTYLSKIILNKKELGKVAHK